LKLEIKKEVRKKKEIPLKAKFNLSTTILPPLEF